MSESSHTDADRHGAGASFSGRADCSQHPGARAHSQRGLFAEVKHGHLPARFLLKPFLGEITMIEFSRSLERTGRLVSTSLAGYSPSSLFLLLTPSLSAQVSSTSPTPDTTRYRVWAGHPTAQVHPTHVPEKCIKEKLEMQKYVYPSSNYLPL